MSSRPKLKKQKTRRRKKERGAVAVICHAMPSRATPGGKEIRRIAQKSSNGGGVLLCYRSDPLFDGKQPSSHRKKALSWPVPPPTHRRHSRNPRLPSHTRRQPESTQTPFPVVLPSRLQLRIPFPRSNVPSKSASLVNANRRYQDRHNLASHSPPSFPPPPSPHSSHLCGTASTSILPVRTWGRSGRDGQIRALGAPSN